jgi:hypothetical protein
MAPKMVCSKLICANCYHATPASERGIGCVRCRLTGKLLHHRTPFCSDWIGDLTELYARKVATRSALALERA